MVRKRVRKRKTTPNAPTRQKKGNGKPKGPAAKVAALQRQIAAMHVNTSPFATAGGHIGGRIGGMFGNSGMGNSIGNWLGSGIGKIFGSGSYKMSANSLWSTSDQCPVMHSNSETVIVRHREYIADINSSVGFALTEYQINPGLGSTFPFLASIASNFQEYNFKGLVFEFKSTSADALNSTNTALGTVAMAIQYRAGASSFTNKQQVLNEMWSADAKPANSFFMPVECAPAECPMDIQYIRAGALATNEDIKFYDLGRLAVATNGSQAASVVGELWASYEVALRKPVLGGAIGIDDNSYSSFRSGTTSLLPLGTVDTYLGINSLGVTISGGSVLAIPKGSLARYVVTVTWLGPAASTYVTPTLGFSNLFATTMNGNAYITTGTGVSGNGCSSTTIVSLVDNTQPGILTYGVGGTLATPVYTYINVVSTDFDIVST